MTLRPPGWLDVGRASEVLRDVFGADLSRDGAAGLHLIGEGSWSRAFGFEADGRALVVRLGMILDDFAKDAVAARLFGDQLPVPDVLAVGTHRGGDDAPGPCAYAVSERVHGTPLEQLDESAWRSVIDDLWRVLAGMAAVERPEHGGLGEWGQQGHGTAATLAEWIDDLLGDQRHARLGGWRRHASASQRALVERAEQAMRRLAPASEGRRRVLHGDLLNRNVVAAGGRVTGLFDWGCALDGDPAWSVSELEAWSPWYPDGLGRLDVRSAYRRHLVATGADDGDLDARIDLGVLAVLAPGLTFALAAGLSEVALIASHLERHVARLR